jgi:type I restriction enzyme R subunit
VFAEGAFEIFAGFFFFFYRREKNTAAPLCFHVHTVIVAQCGTRRQIAAEKRYRLFRSMLSETKTRKQDIDEYLKQAGWTILPFHSGLDVCSSKHHAVEEFPTSDGFADYLLVSSGCPLGVIEAKRQTFGSRGALPQAERYSRGITSEIPFLYSTNGTVIYFHDTRHTRNVSRQLARFHSPAALLEMVDTDFIAACHWFETHANNNPRLRSYQHKANEAIENALTDGKRQMLVTMASGTGKTFTMVNQVYRLLKSGVARRVLFLVDRRALAAQAVRAFSDFQPEPNSCQSCHRPRRLRYYANFRKGGRLAKGEQCVWR